MPRIDAVVLQGVALSLSQLAGLFEHRSRPQAKTSKPLRMRSSCSTPEGQSTAFPMFSRILESPSGTDGLLPGTSRKAVAFGHGWHCKKKKPKRL